MGRPPASTPARLSMPTTRRYSWAISRASFTELVRQSAPTTALSSTVSLASGRTFCQVRAMPSLHTLSGERPLMRWPLKTTSPFEGG